MRTISGIVDTVLGRAFEIHCVKIDIRGQTHQCDSEPYFSGPGLISGEANGDIYFRVYNTMAKDPKELMRLSRVAANATEFMALDAIDYEGTDWTGAWFIPKIYVSNTGQCIISGKFPNLSTRIAFTSFDRESNTTGIYYSATPRLPLLKATQTRRIRGEKTESTSTRHDHSDLDFDGAAIRIEIDVERTRTKLSTTYRDRWLPPYCEIGLADAFAFVTASDLRPRVVVRGFEKDALVFVRYTPPQHSGMMHRPIVDLAPGDRQAFWDVFLAFLRDCEQNIILNPDKLDSSRPFRLFSELVSASTGTIHGFILSLVIGIEDVVDQIIPESEAPKIAKEELEKHLVWTGPDHISKERMIGILASLLNQTSTNKKLQQLIEKGVVTSDQQKLWNDLRNKVAIAHGRLIDYNDPDLIEKRDQLVTMFYRLMLRALKYRGPMTDYAKSPPKTFELNWKE